MSILDSIDDAITWYGSSDAYNSAPADDIDPDSIGPADPDYCEDCGHYGGCYNPGISCGDYRCCVTY